jgi:hypothetical protein
LPLRLEGIPERPFILRTNGAQPYVELIADGLAPGVNGGVSIEFGHKRHERGIEAAGVKRRANSAWLPSTMPIAKSRTSRTSIALPM